MVKVSLANNLCALYEFPQGPGEDIGENENEQPTRQSRCTNDSGDATTCLSLSPIHLLGWPIQLKDIDDLATFVQDGAKITEPLALFVIEAAILTGLSFKHIKKHLSITGNNKRLINGSSPDIDAIVVAVIANLVNDPFGRVFYLF